LQKLCKTFIWWDYSILKIVSELRNQYLWISIDETTDDTGRHVANVVIGILSSNDYEGRKRFLLNMALLEKANTGWQKSSLTKFI